VAHGKVQVCTGDGPSRQCSPRCTDQYGRAATGAMSGSPTRVRTIRKVGGYEASSGSYLGDKSNTSWISCDDASM
jgi:hypothetical protein